MSEGKLKLHTNGAGYEEMRVDVYEDGRQTHRLKHHRLLAYAWGKLDSVFFDDDMREVHHCTPVEWVNTEDNLVSLLPEEHRQVDDGRAKIRASHDLDAPLPPLPDDLEQRCLPVYEKK